MSLKTTKSGDRRQFVGEWRFVEVELWSHDDLDLVGPAGLTLDRNSHGSMRFLAIEAGLDYRPDIRDGRPAIEFTFDGSDEGDRISGRGWAILSGNTLRGHLYFHDGDDSAFRATRQVGRRRRLSQVRAR
jgi:hypothetical protein